MANTSACADAGGAKVHVHCCQSIIARYVEAAQRPLNNRCRLVHATYGTDPQ